MGEEGSIQEESEVHRGDAEAGVGGCSPLRHETYTQPWLDFEGVDGSEHNEIGSKDQGKGDS